MRIRFNGYKNQPYNFFIFIISLFSWTSPKNENSTYSRLVFSMTMFCLGLFAIKIILNLLIFVFILTKIVGLKMSPWGTSDLKLKTIPNLSFSFTWAVLVCKKLASTPDINCHKDIELRKIWLFFTFRLIYFKILLQFVS